MKIFLVAGGALILGFVLGATFNAAYTRHLRRRVRELREGQKRETMKVVVWACVLNGFAWIWCSYILAWRDKVQIAETRSTAAVTEIIGAVLAYGLKSLVENLSKNNHWPDKRPADTEAPPDQNDTDGGGAVG